MVIKDKLISDLELRLSKFKPHRDLKFNRSLLEFWIDSSRDPLVYQKIIAELSERNTIDQHFIDTEAPLNAALDATSLEYVVTPTNPIMQLPDDRGIVLILEPAGGYALIKTDYDEIDVVDNLRYAAPAEDRLFWHRDEGTGIVIDGADATTPNVDLILKYVRANWGEDTLLTEVYPITSDLIDPLLKSAEQKAIAALQMGQADVLTNDIPGE
jgi:hypothetical protein